MPSQTLRAAAVLLSNELRNALWLLAQDMARRTSSEASYGSTMRHRPARKGRLISSSFTLCSACVAWCLTVSALLAQSKGPDYSKAQASAPANPIQHVIFIVKENRSFDHYFG